MFIASPTDRPPEHFSTQLQQSVYTGLKELGIPFLRVACDPAVTVDDCRELTRLFGVPVVKTLFVANRQLTRFHLVSMPGDKPFVTRDFSKALGVSRVSFVSPSKMMELLSIPVGAVSPLCAVADHGLGVQVVIDEVVLSFPAVAFPDGTTTNYLRLSTEDIVSRYLPACSHKPFICQL